MKVAAVLIFGLTYLLIASRKLQLLPIGRAAGALLGAVLMVGVGVLSPHESYVAIDHDTIVLLFSMMLLTAYLEHAGFFEAMARGMLVLCRTPWRLLVAVVILAGMLSAFLVNDTVCLFLTPVLVLLCERGRLPFAPFLLALATSANIGSAATLVGNPQNMIIGSMSHLPFRVFLLDAGAGAAAAAGLLVNIALLWLYFGRGLPAAIAPHPTVPSTAKHHVAVPATIALGVVVGFFFGLHLGYTTLAGVLVLMVLEHREPREAFARVDWTLLVFFCCLFVVVAGLAKTGLIERAWSWAAPDLSLRSARGLALFTALMTLGSNVVSNVPMVLLTGPHLAGLGDGTFAWVLLAFTTTVAGNLTLVGSVANIIVVEGAREHYNVGFWEYLRFGVASTVLVLAVGVCVLYVFAY